MGQGIIILTNDDPVLRPQWVNNETSITNLPLGSSKV